MVRWLPHDRARKSAVLVAFLAASGVYFVYTYVHAPRARLVETQEARLRRLEADNVEAEANAAEQGLLERRVSHYLTQLRRLETLVPSDRQVSALLESLSGAEGGSGVEVIRMRPQPIQHGLFYDHWSYEMEILGNYHAVASFLTDVASLERILVPEVVTIVPAAAPDGLQPHDGNVKALLRIRTYAARPEQGNAPRQAATESGRDDA
ncbi:MAG: type 4a pilus biogenesis protein PilO [Gemmatimonadetes bacterium]|nr:type 4a pilus biogenesis protein PilO [Gemmatimonadota bacterium]MCY3610093.1 type 4a pilus biogenesis protein PilO [Gemmatimonadota bacterium]MCY3676066.1 type 4a pilus biogenesis protein PilO [Gemmatimonadota bacterium]MYA42251.1 type 4a pilus biogenesis protein PilO [Gemmatimonadota bacterium]MYE94121.1 type 4a pilus biogenesis protein PilO [Gemmatimonadota bacterium]